MPFMCQNDSYLKTYTSSVKSVEVAPEGKSKKSPTENGQGDAYEVVLEDTILFPEGGGQPDDRGTINDIPVLGVSRRGADAVHVLPSPLEVGEKVTLNIDWERRFDHMQQHSGQHLITAIIDQEFGHKTTSWDLGKSISFIELDTPTLSQDKVKRAEDICNEKIRESVGVKVHVTEVGSPLLQDVRARGLPDDHVGSVRIIEIEGVDANMCCGTHVKNLSDLLCVKLLSAEKGKKSKTNLYFLVGNRVLNYVDQKYTEDKKLTKILKCPTAEHVDAVDRNLKSLKQAQKVSTSLLREIAGFEARSFKSNMPEDKFLRLHRTDGNNEYMNILANEIGDKDCYLFLTVGNEKAEGLFLLAGPNEFMKNCGQQVCDVIKGKAGINRGRMQGKATNMKECSKVVDLIKDYIKKKTQS